MRYLVACVGVAALVGFTWVFSLPSKTECIASGRVVDPTERYCLSAAGYQQLQEHALFHSREGVLAAVILIAGGYAFRRYRRRRSVETAATA